MTTIYQLSQSNELEPGDFVPVFVLDQGDARKVSLSTLLEWIEANQTGSKLRTVHFTPPVAPGFIVTLDSNTHTILTAAASFGSGAEFTLDQSPSDKDEVLFTTNQGVSNPITFVPGAGRTVQGAPTSMSAGGYFRLKYDATYQVWQRVG